MKNILNTQPGFIHADWCGDPACETKIKEFKGCKSRCITEEPLITGKCAICGKEAKHHVIIGYEVKNSKLAAENRRLTRENKELATRLMETQAQALYQRRFVESLIEEVTHEDTVG